ncbi:MAG: SRPBCC domain-containing protein [Chitinophaga sp.]|uniref:SRPBCC family protein n=1 Tax=Chitinophaga sp. TaxID=1869181 RepID=UPI0025C160E5|nr:SRPBCC domain-containing protein [Chitinophaga sp.]MBV8251918.1 SRPBCC domain-containing protein [Chitinophaga sp.]
MGNQVSTQEVFIEETFNASVEKVFSAWTDPEKLMKWYAPEGCTFRFKHMDIRPGGTFHTCISNEKVGDCWTIGEYREILPLQKIVFTLMNADENGQPIDPASIGFDPDWPAATVVTVTFKAENGKTKLQLRQTVSQALAKKTGAYPSWLQMLEKMRNTL